jgi:hypothetical protein
VDNATRPTPQTDMQAPSAVTSLRPVVAWIVIFQSALLVSAYWFRNTYITGIDVIIVAGLVMSVFFGGILFLVLHAGKRQAR